ncbi:MAG: biopolymer transporter ExbD [Pseudomonadota bacterium]|nr:biopolymer transporter ExbD [Pseudomonadota bacterium]
MSRRKEVFSNVNIVPYLDVMLVLLVIFMATTPIVQMGVNVELPQGSASALKSQDPVVLSIDRVGNRYLQIGQRQSEALQKGEQVSDWLRQNKVSANRAIHLQADKHLPWQKVLSVLVEVNQMGWSKVALMTEAEKGDQSE